jgi:glycosyltransferase involved in cell wall biosynthesis
MVAPQVYSTGPIVGSTSGRRIADILASASLYVMPSVFEPFGIAFLEAMAAGLPCVGTDLCAMPEIIGSTGAIVPARDPHTLSRAMIAFLSNPNLCRTRGHEARVRYRERYGWANVAAKIRASIDRVIPPWIRT